VAFEERELAVRIKKGKEGREVFALGRREKNNGRMRKEKISGENKRDGPFGPREKRVLRKKTPPFSVSREGKARAVLPRGGNPFRRKGEPSCSANRRRKA